MPAKMPLALAACIRSSPLLPSAFLGALVVKNFFVSGFIRAVGEIRGLIPPCREFGGEQDKEVNHGWHG